jgi:hypothetical protein
LGSGWFYRFKHLFELKVAGRGRQWSTGITLEEGWHESQRYNYEFGVVEKFEFGAERGRLWEASSIVE